MPIAFDASSNATTGFGDNLTWSHTCTGADRALFVAVAVAGSPTISGVTYNGIAMTAVETGDAEVRLFGLLNPATGSNNIVASFSGLDAAAAVAASYTGVDQTTGWNNVVASATGNGSPSISVTSATGNLVVGASLYLDLSGQSVQTVGADQTSRGSVASGASYAILSDEAGAASTTHSYTRDGAFYYTQRIVAVNVIAAGGSSVPFRSFYDNF
jgi:hypothetical protein